MSRLPICRFLLALCIASPAFAQPVGALGEDFLYRIQPGDTLIGLTQRYVRDARVWQQLQTLNQVQDPYKLPIAVVLRIPLSLIPREIAQARLVYVHGPVHVGQALARVGESVAQGSVVSTGEGGSATLALDDDTLITVSPNTELRLEQVSKFQGTQLTDTVITMPQGALDATVAPSGSGVGRFEVRTPVAVTGVRGTRFHTESAAQGQTDAVTEGSVRLQPRPGGGEPVAPTLLQEGYGSLVRADGTLAGSWPLLPAPAVSEPVSEAGRWVAQITPVMGAAGYELVVARDPDGHFQVSSAQLPDTEIRVVAAAAGVHYLIVRALDEHGIRGHDTRLRVLAARPVLRDSRGDAVLSGMGESILLSIY